MAPSMAIDVSESKDPNGNDRPEHGQSADRPARYVAGTAHFRLVDHGIVPGRHRSLLKPTPWYGSIPELEGSMALVRLSCDRRVPSAAKPRAGTGPRQQVEAERGQSWEAPLDY